MKKSVFLPTKSNASKVFLRNLILAFILFFNADAACAAAVENPQPPPALTNSIDLTKPLPEWNVPDIPVCDELKNPALYVKGRKILKFLIHGKDGWVFRTVDFRMDFSLEPKTEKYFKDLVTALGKKNIKLVMVVQPPRAMIAKAHIDPAAMPKGYDPEIARAGFRKLLKTLEGFGITVVDLSEIPDGMSYFATGDPHWNREGARFSAEKTANIIKQFPEYAEFKKKEFLIEPSEIDKNEKGDLEEFVEEVCNIQIPLHTRYFWATTEKDAETSESSLLGDIVNPEITVVGTSNSAHDDAFNFVGSLKQFLSVDINNAALAAGGFGGAAALYYALDLFHQASPKIIVWEILAHHEFNDDVAFRQMMPAIQGPCDDGESVAHTTLQINDPVGQKFLADAAAEAESWKKLDKATMIKLRDEARKRLPPATEVAIFDHLEKKEITGKNHYLYLEVTNPESRKLKIGVLYANGDAEEVDISRSRRGANNGKYYLEFNQEIDQSLMMVQLETDKPVGDVRARICKTRP